jgi:hypothetical protein
MEFVISPTPDPSSFLRELFNPQNTELFAIYQRITALALASENIAFWRTELINSSRRDLFTQDGFAYSLNQLDQAVDFTQEEKALLNPVLAKYYINPIT